MSTCTDLCVYDPSLATVPSYIGGKIQRRTVARLHHNDVIEFADTAEDLILCEYSQFNKLLMAVLINGQPQWLDMEYLRKRKPNLTFFNKGKPFSLTNRAGDMAKIRNVLGRTLTVKIHNKIRGF